MAAETLYVPKGAGHSAPGDRRGYSGPKAELFEAFRAWIDSKPVYECTKGRMQTRANRTVDHMADSHRLAMELLPDLGDVAQEEINSVFLPFTDHPKIEHAGIFISAAHQKKGVKDVAFSTKGGVPISRLGYRFGSDFILLVRAGTGYSMGDEGEGTFVNYGSAESMGHLDAPGLFINMGKIEEAIGGGDKRSLSINLGSCVRYGEGTWLNRYSDVINRFIFSKSTAYEIPGVMDFMSWVEEGLNPEKSDDDIFRFLRENDLRKMVNDMLEAGNAI